MEGAGARPAGCLGSGGGGRLPLPWRILLALLMAAAVPACVERTIEVRSDPPGARVFVDGRYRGRTPAALPFHHYGVRRVTVVLDDGSSITTAAGIWPPWYLVFPLDFFFECLFPFRVEDRRSFSFDFREERGGEPEEEGLIGRGEDLRRELEGRNGEAPP